MDSLGRRLQEAGCVVGTAWAEPLDGGAGVGVDEDVAVTPASVIKVPVAQAVLNAIAGERLDGRTRVLLPASRRTPGPVTVSLMADDVEMSLRDLVTLSLTISDNPATDALIDAVGVDAVNDLLGDLGLESTWLGADLMTMLEEMAVETGYADFEALAAVQHGPDDPTPDELRQRIAATAALDPSRGSRTTARDSVRLLQAIWNDEAGPAEACAAVRRAMGRQLTRHRIASGFPPDVTVAAKSGGLMGVVRNEIGVVSCADGRAYAVAVFTRTDPARRADPRPVDAAIGAVAADAVDRLRA
jgi:beta-lactamase class A